MQILIRPFSYCLLGLLPIIAGCANTRRMASIAPQKGAGWAIPLDGSAQLPMQWIQPGGFDMGSPELEQGRKADEGPVTKVTISNGYWLGRTELTIGQWKAITGETLRDHIAKMLVDEKVYDFGNQQKKIREFMNFNPSDPDRIMANENDELPMYFVSWDDGIEFCRLLTIKEKAAGRLPKGYEYNLPTEAQWEYACRAGSNTSTFAGDLVMNGRAAPVLDSIAWYGANNSIGYTGKKLGNSGAGPRNAGEKKGNAWGLQDMPGNLWEWCLDQYAPYPGGNVIDPVASGAGVGRVNRGGSWGSAAASERSASRASNPQPEKSAYRGFRIALCAVR